MKKLFFLTVIIIVCVVGIVQHNPASSVSGIVNAQTIPTRTPVPPPTNPPNNNNNPQPTNTAVLLPTATLIPTETPIPATLAPTPIGGYLPTAQPCSNLPTVQAFNNTNVRVGPSTDYDIVGQIVVLEVRPIIGRAQNAQWWLVQLADGTTGFVLNDVVNVSGYTDIVPIVPVPELNDSTPTPGPVWNPTPNPSCTVTPTPLPTNTAVPTNTPAPTATLEPSPTDTAVLTIAPTDTAVSETPTIVAQPTRVPETETTPLPTAVPLESASESGNSNWLLFGAGGLLVVGTIAFARRRRVAE